jgi:hypothetical protein
MLKFRTVYNKHEALMSTHKKLPDYSENMFERPKYTLLRRKYYVFIFLCATILSIAHVLHDRMIGLILKN